MEYLIIFLIAGLSIGLITLYYFRFVRKTYPQKTQQLLNNVINLESLGLKRKDDRYEGWYRNFYISIFATKGTFAYNVYGGERYQVWVSTSAGPGLLKSSTGFFGKYLVSGQQENFAYIGFMVNAQATNDSEASIHERLDELITHLDSTGIKPYVF